MLDLLASTAATLFLTGHADSGKTTFVRHWRATTGETVAVLAPTGIARHFPGAGWQRTPIASHGLRHHRATRRDRATSARGWASRFGRAWRSGVCDGGPIIDYGIDFDILYCRTPADTETSFGRRSASQLGLEWMAPTADAAMGLTGANPLLLYSDTPDTAQF